MDKSFYTIDEVANLLRISRKTVEKYINNGELVVIKLDRSVRIPVREFELFIENRTKNVVIKSRFRRFEDGDH